MQESKPTHQTKWQESCQKPHARLRQVKDSESLQHQLSASEEALCAAITTTRAPWKSLPQSWEAVWVPVPKTLVPGQPSVPRLKEDFAPISLSTWKARSQILNHCCGGPTHPWVFFSKETSSKEYVLPHCIHSGPYLSCLILNSSHLSTC